VEGVLVVIVLVQKNTYYLVLLSRRIVIQGSAYDGSDFLLKITTLLSVSKRLGISLEFLISFLCVEQNCAK